MIQRIIGYIARLIQCQICLEMMVLTLLYCERCCAASLVKSLPRSLPTRRRPPSISRILASIMVFDNGEKPSCNPAGVLFLFLISHCPCFSVVASMPLTVCGMLSGCSECDAQLCHCPVCIVRTGQTGNIQVHHIERRETNTGSECTAVVAGHILTVTGT